MLSTVVVLSSHYMGMYFSVLIACTVGGHLIVYIFWLQIVSLLWKFFGFGEHVNAFLLAKYLGVELLGHMVGICSDSTNFSCGCTNPSSNVWEFQLLHIGSIIASLLIILVIG